MPLHRTLRTAAAVTAAASLLVLTACAADEAEADRGDAISAERCALNEEAGTISYLTGYQYQASASILEVLAADELGYFDDLCLDVEIQAGTGDTGTNAQLVAAGTVQFTSVSQQDLLVSYDNGLELRGISSYSNAGLEVLMTPTAISDLTELDGTILGQKGALPTTVEAMLDEAGVDVDSIQQVTVGYDPSVLPRGQVDSLTGFVSNEPNLLEAMGEEVAVWRPYEYEVPSSLGAMAVNPEFADEHPTVVEDFLRAAFHAYDYCLDQAEECVGFAAELSGEGYDPEHNQRIWSTETEVIAETAADRPLGTVDLENVAAINAMLAEYGLLEAPLADDEASGLFDPAVVEAITADGELVWPAP